VTSGADSGSGGSGALRPRGGSDPAGGAGGGSGSGQAAIDARVDGSTAGVVRDGRQAVFASSTAPERAKSKSRAAARETPSAGRVSATEDLWTTAPSATGKPSMATAAEVGGDSGGLGATMVAGIIVLGLGLVAIIGGVLVAEVRRRRETAGAAKH
jgi:hypothetical protein